MKKDPIDRLASAYYDGAQHLAEQLLQLLLLDESLHQLDRLRSQV
ncbi:hypothetical protein [Georgfuchsia toluolica]|nr:hypothetical protein [Georgfuchsia toluolica]